VSQQGWQGIPAVQSVDNANYSLLTAMKYNLERIIAILNNSGLPGVDSAQALSYVTAEVSRLRARVAELEARIAIDADVQ
jgi:thiamine pyrophosphate-dependent acetolactate synthase large subunit-like protein